MIAAPADPTWDEGLLAWQAAVRRVLKGEPLPEAMTADGLSIPPLAPMSDHPALDLDPARSVRTVQRIDHPDAAEAAAQATADIEGGAAGLTLVLAGAPSARGFGVALHRADDVAPLRAVLARHPLALRLEPGTFELPSILPSLVEMGAPGSTIDIGLDPIALMAVSGGAPEPWPALARQSVEAVAATRAQELTSPVLRMDGRPHHEAGATAAQELAAAVATGLAYLRALEAGGMPLEAARDALSVTLAVDAEVFVSLAKLRAFRLLWGRVETACGLAPKPLALHAETSWRMLATRDPWTNLPRGGIACAAAILGGADSVTVLPHTAALGLPDALTRRIARNVPLILLAESGLGRVDDPAAGAGGFAALTQSLCSEAWQLLQAIEREGGMVAALERGSWQQRVAKAQAQRRAALASGAATIVGTTAFPNALPEEAAIPPGAPTVWSPPDVGAGGPRFPALEPRRDAELVETGGLAP